MDDVMNAKEQGTFNLDEFVQGRGFPRDTVTVFTDEDAGYDYTAVQKRLTDLAQDKDALDKRSSEYKEKQVEFKELEAKAAELLERIKASALTFHLRGIAPGHIKKINKDVLAEAEKEEWDESHAGSVSSWRIIAAHIIKAVNAAGDEDKSKFTEERVENLEMVLPESEWTKLDRKCMDLSFKSTYFDSVVDAGFLPRS